MTKRPLGRGLSALIPTDQSRADNDEIREIQIDLIQPGRQQPRTTFNQAKLEELAQSIRTTGIIQPLLVRPSGGRAQCPHRSDEETVRREEIDLVAFAVRHDHGSAIG